VDCGGGTCGACANSKKCSVGADCVSLSCSGSPQKTCQAATCADNIQNQGESDADCSGPCTKCGQGKKCAAPADCLSGVCTGLVCQAPACNDTVQNGAETDADCGGGTCPKCGSGKKCVVAADCVAGVCTAGFCQAAGCSDGVKNGTETDIDCGGSCAACADTKLCSIAADCVSLVCSGNPKRCQTPTCSDGAKNQGESDADCGGPNCSKCIAGKTCGSAADCQSSVCTGGLCIAATCSDGVQNQGESDKDCGGPNCSKCIAGKACTGNTDCQSGVCSGNVCQAPTCGDHVKNGAETDIDCGGGTCAACAAGLHCAGGSDCTSLNCVSTVCVAATCSDLIKNQGETDKDCGGPNCGKCAPGKTCLGGNDCQSLICQAGTCTTPTCADGVQNQAETDVDCGSAACPACATGKKCGVDGDCNNARCAVCCGNTYKTCQPQTCSDNLKNQNETDTDCGGVCPHCGPGKACLVNNDCDCLKCSGGLCASPVCGDGIKCGNEACDDGFHDACGTCNSNCQQVIDGNDIHNCRCADATAEQTGGTHGCITNPPYYCIFYSFYNNMVGCGGSVAWGSRNAQCGVGYTACTAQQWVNNRNGNGPSRDFWVNEPLHYQGPGDGDCAALVSGGTTCFVSGQQMRVCSGTAADADGNTCAWANCGLGTNTPNQYFGGCGGTGGTLCCPKVGCADGTNEQAFYGGMVGCGGSVLYTDRATLCASGWVPCNSKQWEQRRGGMAPTHHYWTDDPLRWISGGTSASCAVSLTTGNNCGANSWMRVCYEGSNPAAGGVADPEGNTCTWVGCGEETNTPDEYFGGCGNNQAGTLCCLP
jgi:hypothetical protein